MRKKLKPGIMKTLPQVKVKPHDMLRDISRRAMPSGKRISSSGKIYWETRNNRSDLKGKRY